MGKFELIRKLTHPAVCIALVTVAISSGIAYGCINHVRNDKQELVVKSNVMVYREATSDELRVIKAGGMKKETQPSLETLQTQERLLHNVRDFFTARYHFNGSYSANEKEILRAVAPLVTDDFLESIKHSFSESKKYEGTDREMKDYRCEVIHIYQNGYSEADMKSKGIQPAYFCLVKINGRDTLYHITMRYKDGEYRINGQDMLGTEQEGA